MHNIFTIISLNDCLIVINGLISLIASFKIGKALIISYTTQTYLETRGIRYEITPDKVAYEKTIRVFLYLMLTGNFIILSWSISRIVNGWQPYANFWIGFSSTAFSMIMLAKSHILLMLSRGDDLRFFNKKPKQ